MLDQQLECYGCVWFVILTVAIHQKAVENHVAWLVALPAWPADSHGIIRGEFMVFWCITGRNPNFVTQVKNYVLVEKDQDQLGPH